MYERGKKCEWVVLFGKISTLFTIDPLPVLLQLSNMVLHLGGTATGEVVRLSQMRIHMRGVEVSGGQAAEPAL